jgi:DNA-binding FadR family transcriptional regulator
LVIAREYGFPTWRQLLEGLHGELAACQHARHDDEPVAAALAAIRAGDAESLRHLLDAHHELVHAEVGAGGSLLGEVAQPDVLGTSLGTRSASTGPAWTC